MVSGQNIIGTFVSNIILRVFSFSIRIIHLAILFLCWVNWGEGSNLIPFSPNESRNTELLYSPDLLSLQNRLMLNLGVSTQAW